MKASLHIQPMYCSRDYNYSSRFNQQYEKSTPNCTLVLGTGCVECTCFYNKRTIAFSYTYPLVIVINNIGLVLCCYNSGRPSNILQYTSFYCISQMSFTWNEILNLLLDNFSTFKIYVNVLCVCLCHGV